MSVALRACLRVSWALAAWFAATSCRSELHDTSAEATPPQAGLAPGKPADVQGASLRCETQQVGPRMLRRLTREQLENSLRDVFPEAQAQWQGFALPDLASPLGFSNDAAVLVVSPQTEREYLASVEHLADAVVASAALAKDLPCVAASAADTCGDQLVARYGPRLFRRQLDDAERQRYRALFASVAAASDVTSAAKWTLVALMQSPHVLYRSELGSAERGGGWRLTPNELATELAYTFGDTTPSADLIERAERGELESAEARVAEARRLLESEHGRASLQRFFRQWLRYDGITTADRAAIGGFEANRARMLQETERFLDAVVFAEAGGLHELLTAPFSFADSSLASYYGWPAGGADFARTQRPQAQQAIGVLAQGALLATAANQDASSPTRRGLLVLERLLCRPRPTPPPVVPPLSSTDPGKYRTTRERYEKVHTQQSVCAGCHAQFDPIGFAFEHFDQGGRYREQEAGTAIDASGALRSRAGETLFAFDGEAELARGLAEQAEVADCVSGLLAAYAYGGGGGASCLAERARAGFAAGEYGIAEYLAQLAAEPHFDRRAADLGAAAEPSPPAMSAQGNDPPDAGVPGGGDAAIAPPPAERDSGAGGAGAAPAGTGGDAAPVPAVGDPPALSVQYLATNAAPQDNVIAPTLQLSLTGGDSVELAGIELRYYFSNEHATQCPGGCKVESYYAGVHPSGMSVMARRSYVSTGGNAAYLSISFDAAAGSLHAGESVELQQQFHTDPYSDFDERDDYSFDPTRSTLGDTSKVTVYRDGKLVWGTPPP